VVISTLFIAQPVANALASIVSGAILGMDGILGLKGWQWVFILEALPAVLLGFVVLKYMTDRPALANWLASEEKNWIEGQLEEERRIIDRQGRPSLLKALSDPRVLALSLIYFMGVMANYGIVFFMPQIIKGMGLSNLMSGFVASVPYIVGTLGLMAWGYSSDRLNERHWHLIAASMLAAAGLFAAGGFGSSYWALAGMSIATIGIYGSRTAFWPMPSVFLTGTAAAGAIALINATGNLGGFVGPFVVGWIKDSTNSFEAGLYVLAAAALCGAIITVLAPGASGKQPCTQPADPAVSQ
jgi:ACS family tartrate transporter-like MFS transporter